MNISSLVKHTSLSLGFIILCVNMNKYEVSDSSLSFADPRKVPNVLSLLYHSFLT